MADTITLDELKAQVGAEPRHSEWFTLDQSAIDTFADVTHDHQWIHVDKEKAKMTPFGGTIAHGFLTLSMLSAMSYQTEKPVEGAAMMMNYGFNKVRFTNPVKAGQRVRGKFHTRSVEEKGPGQILTTNAVTVEIEGEDRPAVVAEWLGLTFMAPKA